MKKLIFSLVALLSFAANAMADATLTLNSAAAEQGKEAEIAISLTNDEPIASFSFMLNLPEGVKYSGNALADRAKGCVTVMDNEVEGGWMIAGLTTGNPIREGEGEMLIVKVSVEESVAVGEYPISLTEIVLTTDALGTIEQELSAATLTVTEAEVVRYTDNQIYAKDITVKEGEDATLLVAYNSTSDVFEYSASLALPEGVSVTNVVFEDVVADVPNFTNEWNEGTLTLSGEYGGGRRDEPAEGGNKVFATITLATSHLEAGEYEITIKDQFLANDDDDFEPADYVVYLVVEAGVVDGINSAAASTTTPLYNLQGQRVSNSHKGLVIKQGKKLVKK